MSRKLYVGNLPFNTDETQLQDLFAQAGTVDTVNVVRDRQTGRARGFAFVEMGTDEEAQTAISMLNSYELGGRALTVNEARPKTDGGFGGGGGYGGGRRQQPAPVPNRAGNQAVVAGRECSDFRSAISRSSSPIRFSASVRSRIAAFAIVSSPARCTCGSRRSSAAISSLSWARVALSVEVGVRVIVATTRIPRQLRRVPHVAAFQAAPITVRGRPLRGGAGVARPAFRTGRRLVGLHAAALRHRDEFVGVRHSPSSHLLW